MAERRKPRAGLARRPRALSLVPAASHADATAALARVVEALWPQAVDLVQAFAMAHGLRPEDVGVVVLGPEAIGGAPVGTLVGRRTELLDGAPMVDAAALRRKLAAPPPDGFCWLVAIGCGAVVSGAGAWRAEPMAPRGCA